MAAYLHQVRGFMMHCIIAFLPSCVFQNGQMALKDSYKKSMARKEYEGQVLANNQRIKRSSFYSFYCQHKLFTIRITSHRAT